MNFISLQFLLFFLLFSIGYFPVQKIAGQKVRQVYLLLGNLVFYSFANIKFLPFIFFSFFGIPEAEDENFDSKNSRYYNFLPSKYIKKYSLKKSIIERKLPILSINKKHLLKTVFTNKKNVNYKEWKNVAKDIDVKKDADDAYYRHVTKTKFFDKNGNRIINSEEIESLYKIIYECKAIGATPILITTLFLPEYVENMKKDRKFCEDFYLIIDEIKTDTKISYYDYSCDSRFQKIEFFMNSDHLNKTGAEVFTDVLLKETIKQEI